MTSTTQATNLQSGQDPHFVLSGDVQSKCQLASRPEADIAAATAWCLKSGPLHEKRIKISGYTDEVKVARDRLLSYGVDPAQITTVYASTAATIDINEMSLGKDKD
jgi:hypothetical protein